MTIKNADEIVNIIYLSENKVMLYTDDQQIVIDKVSYTYVAFILCMNHMITFKYVFNFMLVFK